MLSYRNLLKQAWNITWKHKFLWFFGLFSTLLAAGGSIEYKMLDQNINQGLINGSLLNAGAFAQFIYTLKNFCLGLAGLFTYDILTIINVLTIMLVCLTLTVALLWLAVSSQAALVISVKKIINNKKKEDSSTIREGLTAGHKKFWEVLGLNIIIKVAVNAVLFIISLPLLLLALKDSSSFVVVYIILFVIFLPIAVSLSLILKYAIAYSVLDNEKLIKSIEEAYKLFRKNWLISLEMAVILFIINFFAGLAILLTMMIIFFPLFLVGLSFNLFWLVILMVLLALVFLVICGSALSTFQISTWTNLFIRLKDGAVLAKLERIFSRK